MGDLSHHIAAADTRLLGALSFDHPTTANYVTARRSCRSYTTGASSFRSVGGAKVARITISSDEWLDTSTLQICFKMHNPNAFPITPQGDSSLFVNRLRCYLAGTLVEDVQHFARVSQVIKCFTPWSARANQEVEQFALRENSAIAIGHPEQGLVQSTKERAGLVKIAGNGTYTFSLRPHASGLLALNRFLPLRWAPVTLEIYLSDPADAINYGDPSNVPAYEFTEIYCQHDFISLDQNMSNSYYKEIESGRALTLSMPVCHCVQNILPVGQNTIAIPIVRSFTRLNSIFCTFANDISPPSVMLYPRGGFTQSLHSSSAFDPADLAHGAVSDSMGISWQWSLGSRLYPETKVESIQQTWSSLVQAVGMSGQDVKSLSISGFQYVNDKFILGQSFQRVPGVFASGVCTRNGDLARFVAYNLDPNVVSQMYVILCADQVIEIGSTGVSVYD